MVLEDRYGYIKDEDLSDDAVEEEISLGTDSITLTTDDENDKDEREIIRLQYDQDEHEDEYYVPGLDDDDDDDRYKRMNLKGDSESDKDLIIYSLNESLQIHKEMVERIQNEKDDIEYQYELEKSEEKKLLDEEKEKVEQEKVKTKQVIDRLEGAYQALLKELEIKKIDYRHMENRFQTHVKDIKSNDDSVLSIQSQIQDILKQVEKICLPLSSAATATTLDYFFDRWPDMMNHFFESEELNTMTICLLTEKMLMETIMHDILQTPIHPGIALNKSFGKIHDWVEKRNTSWAARMRQQICAFLVKQTNEEAESTENIRNMIIHDNWEKLCHIYKITEQEEKDELMQNWTKVVDDAIKLNIAMKCQDNPVIEILQIDEGTLCNGNTMKSFGDGDIIAFIVSPPFVATPILSADKNEGFLIPAKVYCV